MVRIINNFPVTIEDICNADTIYGCNDPILKVKIAHQQPNRVLVEYIEVLGSLQERVGKLKIAADVVFVNRIPFVVSVSTGVDFTTVEYVCRRLNTVITNSIGEIFQFYKNNGYTIRIFLMDRKFECIRNSLPEEANLNTTATNDNVPDIERKNLVIK